MSEKPRMTITGRTPSAPVIQNLPGSLAHALGWAFERNDYTDVLSMLAVLYPAAPSGEPHA